MSLAQALGTDDGLVIEHYNRGVNNNPSPSYLQYNGLGRVGVRYDAGASGLGVPVKSVWVFCRRYGNPTGNVTVNVRKGSDDTVASTIGTFDIRNISSSTQGSSFAVRNGSNTWNMVASDVVSVEFPSSATDGLEIALNTTVGLPSNYVGRIHNGTSWNANTANPPAIYIKG